MRLYMRPKPKSHVHTMLARISLVHASEITHLSLQTFHKPQEDKGYSYMHGFLPLPSGRRTRQEVGRHGRHLTSLRVLEVIQAEVVDPRHRSTACVMATKTLIENTATTLRTLSIVSTIDELDSRVDRAQALWPEGGEFVQTPATSKQRCCGVGWGEES